MVTKGDHRSNLTKTRLIPERQLERFSEGKTKKLPLDARGEFEPYGPPAIRRFFAWG